MKKKTDRDVGADEASVAPDVSGHATSSSSGAVIEPMGVDAIRSRILTVRGVQVLLDRDLAALYGVTTGALNQAVKRNMNRFPERFMFQLDKTESEDKSSQRGTESSQTAGESAQETAESSQRAGESSQTVAESTQEIERWIANALPTGIRSDARANMVEVMKLIHTNSTETAESMAAKIGISMRGVQKNSCDPSETRLD